MDRKNGKIAFSKSEQDQFKVAESVSVESALETARAFTIAANNVLTEAIQMDGSESRDTTLHMSKRIGNASELLLFSSEIFKICEPELAAADMMRRHSVVD